MNDKNIHQNNGIWNIAEEVLEQNSEQNNETIKENEEELTANRMYDIFSNEKIKGFIINKDGNIVSVFSYSIKPEDKDKEKLKFEISKNGFLSKAYTDEGLNILFGYGNKMNILGLIDPEFSLKLNLSKKIIDKDDEKLILKIDNDELFDERGINIIVRDIDVIEDNLDEDVKKLYLENIEENNLLNENENDEKNTIENNFEEYLKGVYEFLGENEGEDK
jgi:hypothetical protein